MNQSGFFRLTSDMRSKVFALLSARQQGWCSGFTSMPSTGWLRSVLLFVFTFFLLPLAQGQGITGSIAGTVTDSTGAAISGALVTVRDTATNSVHKILTSSAGTYTVPQLPPGPYSVTVDKASFKTYKQSAITLSIDQVAEIDAQLANGAASDTVEVTSAGPVIQTTDSSVGSVIDSQAIQNTPLNGRLGINGLIALAPGVQGAGAQDQLNTRGLTASIGTGGRSSYGGLGSTFDGVTNQEVSLQRGEGEVPSLDAIAQFKILTTGAPAEFNQPAQIIVVSASGTNQLHGGAFEFNRSKGTGAKTYNFSSAAAPARPPYQRNEYGGNLSGPIVVPHLYDGRDKSFFFVAYEGFHLTQSFVANTVQPSALERQGIFTEFAPGSIIDPLTGTPFTGNTIPLNRLNAVDLQLLSLLYPKPTAPGVNTTNTFEQVQETSKSSRFSLRLDHKLSDKDQLRFTYLRAFYGPNPTNGPDSLQGGNAQDGEHNQNFIVGWTHAFSPTLLLDTYAAYFHLPIFRTPQNHNVDFSSIIPGLGPELIEGAPQINITNIQSVSESGSHDLAQDAQIVTAVTKVFAKHTVKAGFSYLYDNEWNEQVEPPARGSYTFNGQYSSNAFADFLLGYPSATGNAAPNNYAVRHNSSQYGVYLQDDWKARKNLTINAGLRYDLQWFSSNPYGNNSLYIPSLKEVVVFGSSYPAAAIPNFINGSTIPIALSSQVGLSNNLFDYLGQDKNNLAPRLGFAYEPIRNTVVRGAFGIYFNLLPSFYVDTAPFSTLPFVASQTYTNATSATSANFFTMNNPFSATGKFNSNPNVASQAKTTTPYTEEYNLAVEHQFPKNLDVRVGYVGQHNLKQNNYGGPGNYALNLNLPAQPVLTTGSVQSTYQVQPFSQISYNIEPIFHSTMNSAQVGIHKQYSQGIAFGAEYQWTRVLGTENVQNPSGATPNDSYGPISGIAPQVLTFNYSYLLPFGRGHTLLGKSPLFIDKLVSGWQISGITSLQNGQPFSVLYSAPGSYTDPNTNLKYVGLVSGRASINPGQPLYPAVKSRTQWFNPNAFQAPTNAAGIKGAAYGNSAYDMLRGPAFQNWDINLQKNIRFLERYNMQLRADSFNVFNHPNFGTPNANVSNANVGTITSPAGTPSYEQRTVEFAAKLSF